MSQTTYPNLLFLFIYLSFYLFIFFFLFSLLPLPQHTPHFQTPHYRHTSPSERPFPFPSSPPAFFPILSSPQLFLSFSSHLLFYFIFSSIFHSPFPTISIATLSSFQNLKLCKFFFPLILIVIVVEIRLVYLFVGLIYGLWDLGMGLCIYVCLWTLCLNFEILIWILDI